MQIPKSLMSLAVLCTPAAQGFAFQDVTTRRSSSVMQQSRRDFIDHIAISPSVLALVTFVEPATASGGATAGGAYLLSAKQRYNERVKEAVKGLLAVEASLAAGNSKDAKNYFASEEAGSWKDLTAAGYLLSNAFRRNSNTPPDR